MEEPTGVDSIQARFFSFQKTSSGKKMRYQIYLAAMENIEGGQ